MSPGSPSSLLSIFIGICLLFGMVIYWGLRTRKKLILDRDSLTIKDIVNLIEGFESLTGPILWGYYYDVSNTVMGMKVRSENVGTVGNFVYPMANPEFEMDSNGEKFRGKKTWHESVFFKWPGANLYKENAIGTIPYISCRQISCSKLAVQAEGVAPIEVFMPMGTLFSLKPIYEVIQNGKKIGFATHLVSGLDLRVVSLPESIPLAVRVFILSNIR